MLKEKGVSRLIVVDDEGSLAGIVSRSDLMHTLIKPTPKMRFPKEGTHMGYYSYAGEKKFRKDDPIRKYITSLVDTIPDSTSKVKILSHLINSEHNSIILVDSDKRPTGFLSIRDILQAITLLRPEEAIPLIVKKPDDVSDEEWQEITDYLVRFGKKLKERMEVEKIEVASKGPKNANGDQTIFNISLVVTPVAGKVLIAKTKQRSFLDGIQEATTMIEKQRNRSGASKDETKHASL